VLGVKVGAGPLRWPVSLCTLIFSTSGRLATDPSVVVVVIVASAGVPRRAARKEGRIPGLP
jgi:hypothetical protein